MIPVNTPAVPGLEVTVDDVEGVEAIECEGNLSGVEFGHRVREALPGSLNATGSWSTENEEAPQDDAPRCVTVDLSVDSPRHAPPRPSRVYAMSTTTTRADHARARPAKPAKVGGTAGDVTCETWGIGRGILEARPNADRSRAADACRARAGAVPVGVYVVLLVLYHFHCNLRAENSLILRIRWGGSGAFASLEVECARNGWSVM